VGRLAVASSLDGCAALTSARPGARAGSTGLSARQRGVLGAAGVANALIFLDQTSVSVALPAIQRELGSSTSELQWTIAAVLGVAGPGSIAAGFEGSGGTGASAGGLEAGMLVAAGAALAAGVAGLVLLPRRARRRPASGGPASRQEARLGR
jgi:hypothetical protein